MTTFLYEDDLPDDFDFKDIVAIDCETLGLNPHRDRLCLVQISNGDGNAHLVKIKASYNADTTPKQSLAPNLCAMLVDKNIMKLFHFARFDIGALLSHFHVITAPVFCTKIASKLVRTYTDKHGLKNLINEILNVDISKREQSSDWGALELSDSQMEYAASDVLFLHELKSNLEMRLIRENRLSLAQACFKFLPERAKLDIEGWKDEDIFSH